MVVPPEVVGVEEQEHPPAGLVADPGRLPRGGRLRQQEGGAAAGRTVTHRLPGASGVSSTTPNPRPSVKNRIASS